MEAFVNTVLGWLGMLGTFTVANILPAVLIAVIGVVLIIVLTKIVNRILEKSKRLGVFVEQSIKGRIFLGHFNHLRRV